MTKILLVMNHKFQRAQWTSFQSLGGTGGNRTENTQNLMGTEIREMKGDLVVWSSPVVSDIQPG